MSPNDTIKKAVKWLGEAQLEHPEKDRLELIREAGIRFNLSPKDCEFLEREFTKEG